jgi:ABC-type nickel/cobalt efflux system permease component RcnA
MEGSNRITKKFFLSFAAVSIQGVFLVLILKLFTTFITDKMNEVTQSTDMLELGMKLLFAALVLMICVNKSGSWSRSLLDAN